MFDETTYGNASFRSNGVWARCDILSHSGGFYVVQPWYLAEPTAVPETFVRPDAA